MVWSSMARNGKVGTALLILFGLMLTPPIVFWVNTDAFLGGWPVMFLWAVGWALFGIGVLVWAATTGAFALNDDQIPPELRDREDVVASDTTAGEPGAGPEGGDA